MSLLEEMNRKATAQGIPLSAHLDITWRCNERCVHCYLDHEGKNEMSTAEIKDVIRQLAECRHLLSQHQRRRAVVAAGLL